MKDGKITTTIVLAAVSLFAVAACDQRPESEPAAEAVVPEPVMLADTTPEAVWAYLEAEDYATNWTFWPDRQPYYTGQEPHGALLNTYLNPAAVRGLELMRTDSTVGDLPFGSMIVKQNHLPDSSLASVTVMYKVELYDPEHQDWWWMKRLPDGTVEASGRVQTCTGCHVQAQDHDYLMTEESES